jgi:precorrin-6A/cobalt-precorrin-6A reductase
MRVLILGGTSEASRLAERIRGRADIEPVVSLAGRTDDPRRLPVATRVGGFGGIEGLKRYLARERIEAAVDATHPFAAIISRNAAEACRAVGVPLLAIRRPAWRPQAGDRWIETGSMVEAAQALGPVPRRVFLTIGRMELGPFAAAPGHYYLVRTIEPIGDALPAPSVFALRARGPFDEEAERALMSAHRIDVLVTKNSGGTATYGKIAAARRLGLPVVVIERPAKPEGPEVEDVEEALAWLVHHLAAPKKRGV